MPGLARASVRLPAFGDHGENLVAVDDMALLVDDDHAIGVAVERDADVGAHFPHFLGERFGSGRTDVEVDVNAVRFDADLDHLGAELPQGLRRRFVRGAVGAIDDDPEAVERDVARQGPLGVFDVARLNVVDAPGAPEIARFGEPGGEVAVHQGFDARLDLIRQLEAVGTEQLDAVVLEQVVRGGDHHPEVATHRARQHRHRRRRGRAEQQYVHADRGETGDERIFDHIAGKPGVLADDHAVTVFAALEHQPRRLADLQSEFSGDLGVRAAANAVGAEILARHVPILESSRNRSQ